MRALLLESANQAAEALEGRIQLAAEEAIAYAEQGLERHEAALGAMGRRLAELSREPPPPEPVAPPPADVGEYLVGAGDWPSCRRLPLRDDDEAAFLADLAHLPIPPGGASRLVIAHIVEHTPAAALAERLLPHWRSRLAPGGELVVVTLDGPAWAADLVRRGPDFAALRERLSLAGAGRPLRHLFDAAGLAQVLARGGLCAGSGAVRRAADDADRRAVTARTFSVVVCSDGRLSVSEGNGSQACAASTAAPSSYASCWGRRPTARAHGLKRWATTSSSPIAPSRNLAPSAQSRHCAGGRRDRRLPRRRRHPRAGMARRPRPRL